MCDWILIYDMNLRHIIPQTPFKVTGMRAKDIEPASLMKKPKLVHSLTNEI